MYRRFLFSKIKIILGTCSTMLGTMRIILFSMFTKKNELQAYHSETKFYLNVLKQPKSINGADTHLTYREPP
jgi:hypothetical protein